MTVSKYFNHNNHAGHQRLANDLVIQAIKQRGLELVFLPRTVYEKDEVLNEVTESAYRNASKLEFYIEDVTNYNGMGSMWGGFGEAAEDSMTLVCSQDRFREVTGQEEPLEKDLIYVPDTDKMYQVSKLLEDEDYRQWGKNYIFQLKCKLYDYSHDDIETDEDEYDLDLHGDDLVNYSEDGDGEIVVEVDTPIKNDVETFEEINNKLLDIGE